MLFAHRNPLEMKAAIRIVNDKNFIFYFINLSVNYDTEITEVLFLLYKVREKLSDTHRHELRP